MSKRATNPQSRENEIINSAMNLAEKQIMDGTASSAVIVHFLKMGTEREKLNRQKLEADTQVSESKARHLDSQTDSVATATEAVEAMKRYSSYREDEYDQ